MSNESRGLELQNLQMNFGALRAVDNVNLNIPDGKFVCMLGPSGCGKTTLLRLIAGLQVPTGGDVKFNGNSLVDIPPHRRDFGMVFQSLALFPHLTVGENITYSLKIRGQSAAQRRQRADELLELVDLQGVNDRRITQLSGGQRQRVAIARALATNPRLFLLDEPLSALDAKLREAMQIELRQLQRKLGITTIVVTHDQREAMTMADYVVIMKTGRVHQFGPPIDIYRKPASAFVADFIGASNLLPCRILDRSNVELFGIRYGVSNIPDALTSGANATLSVRPEDLQIQKNPKKSAHTATAKVAFIRDLGSQVEIMLAHQSTQLVATVAPKDRPSIDIGNEVGIMFSSDACTVFSA